MDKFQRVRYFDRIEMGINLDKWVTASILCSALIISFLFWIIHCPSHRFSRWSAKDHTHSIMSRFFPSHKHSIGLKALKLCVLVSNIIKIQSHLIVLERPFWILFLWPLLFEFVFSVFIVHFSCDISHDNATTKRSQTPNTYTHADTFTRQRKDIKNGVREKREEDIIEFDCCFEANIVLFPLFEVERYCFRVILCRRDIFNIESSMCKATVVYLYTISLIWLMTNGRNVKIFPSECDLVSQFLLIDTQFSIRWEHIFSFALTLSLEGIDEPTNNHLYWGLIPNYISVISFRLRILNEGFCYGKLYFVVSFHLKLISVGMHFSACSLTQSDTFPNAK